MTLGLTVFREVSDMPDPLQALLESALQNNQFAPTSRYAGIEKATHVQPDGTTVVHLKRRLLPIGRSVHGARRAHGEGRRTARHHRRQYLGDPEQFWRVCDANEAMRPEELTEEAGRTVKITLPEGIAGSAECLKGSRSRC